MNYPVLQLKPKREKSIVQRHPWIFSGALEKLPDAEEGSIIEVRSAGNQILGYGFYSKLSQISCRMFHWGKFTEDFDKGDYWSQKIKNAVGLRKNLIDLSQTNAYRLVHAEGDFLPGFIVDLYDDVAVAQVMISGIAQRKDHFLSALSEAGIKNIYHKNSASSRKQEDVEMPSGWLSGKHESPVIIKENNLRFKVDFEEGQKTGFFLDQRDNRKLVGELSKDRTVLNAFSYTGGFSIYSLGMQAKEVHSLDISEEAVAMAEENVALNFNNANHKAIAADCFDYLKDMPENVYDMIVLDPPAFAKHARAVDKAARGYKDINMRAFRKIKKGGIVCTYSCSGNISKDLFQKIVFGAAADAGRNVRIIYQLHQPTDHPVNIFHPEGEYLKGLALWVE